jgi:hypothetical protein
MLLLDLAVRSSDIEAHYSDAGVMPREAMHLDAWNFVWSLHSLSGSTAFEAALFVLTGLGALCILVGYRTFWATLAMLVLELSMQARNPLIRDGQDDLLRILLFWSVFLPLGARWSLDARRGRTDWRARLGLLPAVAFVLQLGTIYVVGAFSKTQSPWWTSGQGVFFALNVGRYQTLLGQFLIQHPAPLVPLTYLVWTLEALGLPLLLCPPLAGRWRTVVVALFWSLHLGFGLGLRLGLFPYVSMAAWIFVLPEAFWDRLAKRFAWAGKNISTVAPAPLSPEVDRVWQRTRLAISGTLGVSLLLMVVSNVVQFWSPEIFRPFVWCADAIGLQQYWSVFAPHARSEAATTDFWLVADGQRDDDTHVALLGEPGELRWERPSLVSDEFANRRWRHYLANLMITWPPRSALYDTVLRSRAAYVHWLCQTYAPLKKVRLWVLKQPLARTDEEATRTELAELRCPRN